MDDRNVMENLLQLSKAACDLYMHGTVEAATANVHQTFNQALNAALYMQDSVYAKMSAKGWYAPEQAEQQNINTVRQKYCC